MIKHFSMIREKYQIGSLPFVFALIFILYHFVAFIGYFGYDDLQYAELSARLLKGEIDWSDHFSFRWTILGATALSYRLFGINDFASSFPSLVITLASLVMIFFTVRDQSIRIVPMALMLFSFNHWTLFYSDKLMPDVYVAFFSTAAILIYYTSKTSGNVFLKSVYFSLLLFGAFLSKETVILMIPLILWWMISDFLLRQNSYFWMISILSGLFLLIGYFLLTGWLTGDGLARFSAIFSNQYVNFCNYADQPAHELLKRISYGWYREMASQGMLAGIILVLPSLLFIRSYSGDRKLRFFITTSVILFLSADFMTISPARYNPMCTDPRHFLFLIPVFAITAGLTLSRFYTSLKYWSAVLILTSATAFILIPVKSRILAEQIIPLGIVAITGIFLGRAKYFPAIGTILLTCALIIQPLRYIPYARHVNYQGQKDFAVNQLNIHPVDYLITDEVQKRMLRYFFEFSDKIPRIYNWDEAEKQMEPGIYKTGLLFNAYTTYLSGIQPGELPWFGRNPALAAKEEAADSTLKLSFFLTSEWRKPELLLVTTNDFEATELYWNSGSGKRDSLTAWEGRFSDQPGEYSATFILPSDSIPLEKYDHLMVTCNCMFYTGEKTDAVLVVSVRENQDQDIWEAYDLFPQVKSYNIWSPVSFHTIIETNRIRKGSGIGIYVWNRSLNRINVDNWEIKISGR